MRAHSFLIPAPVLPRPPQACPSRTPPVCPAPVHPPLSRPPNGLPCPGSVPAGLSFPHTVHCLGSGEIMISAIGDKDGNPRGNFLILAQDLKVRAWLRGICLVGP